MTTFLGQQTRYPTQYDPFLLQPIARAKNRNTLKRDGVIASFYGVDIWNHYEVSWLNKKGKPQVALAEIIIDCHTTHLIESKSLKLYFNSLNNHRFASIDEVKELVNQDLSNLLDNKVSVNLKPLTAKTTPIYNSMSGELLDTVDIACDHFEVNSALLSTEPNIVSESLYSNLLRSNCLVTGQPDWASVQISYQGPKINSAGLLAYIVSYREHQEFHEHCIERIFTDIMHYCQPQQLTVYGRYTRRGGIDINPYRSTHPDISGNLNTRLVRQ